MASLTIAVLILTITPAEQQERYDVARQTLQREVARYQATIRDYERRIAEEPNDERVKELRSELDRCERGTGAILGGIWIEVQKMRRKIRPLPVEAA